jgi:dTDP-4-dehydrorhamnose 3,5-epimerase
MCEGIGQRGRKRDACFIITKGGLRMRSGEIADTELPGVRLLAPRRHCDSRGFFSEVWREDALREAGINARFVQENHALSHAVGTIRGLHFQIGASAQAKLIRCPRGSILDVAVDIRGGSPRFGRQVAAVLSAENWRQLFVPVGFAHGYCTLEPDSEVIYQVSAYYDPQAERGVLWNDPAIGIAWPVDAERAILTDRDRRFPRLAELPNFFPFAEFPDAAEN